MKRFFALCLVLLVALSLAAFWLRRSAPVSTVQAIYVSSDGKEFLRVVKQGELWSVTDEKLQWILGEQHPWIEALLNFTADSESKSQPISVQETSLSDYGSEQSWNTAIEIIRSNRVLHWRIGPYSNALGGILIFEKELHEGYEKKSSEGILFANSNSFLANFLESRFLLKDLPLFTPKVLQDLLDEGVVISDQCFGSQFNTQLGSLEPWQERAITQLMNGLNRVTFSLPAPEILIPLSKGFLLQYADDLLFPKLAFGIYAGNAYLQQRGEQGEILSTIAVQAPDDIRRLLTCEEAMGSLRVLANIQALQAVEIHHSNQTSIKLEREMLANQGWVSHFLLDTFFVEQFLQDIKRFSARRLSSCPVDIYRSAAFLTLSFAEESLSSRSQLREETLFILDKRQSQGLSDEILVELQSGGESACYLTTGREIKRIFPSQEQLTRLDTV